MLPMRLTSYFRFAREEIVQQVPPTARRILDVGCGAGILGEQLRRRQPCEVWGIECDPDAAREAGTRLDRVIATTVDAALPELPTAYFDTLIAADVLEHVIDPWGTLRALAPTLAPDATVLISLPNLQHHAVLRDLLGGRFTYAPAGILDQTHLRFFTHASAVELARRAGFHVEHVLPVYDGGRDRRAAQRGGLPADLSIPASVPPEDVYATQFLLVARAPAPPPDTSRVRVSIVMLTFNRLEVTQQAIASLRATSQQPYELIVVDNGSTDGTPAYLDQLEREGVRVVRNAVNRGVAAGWNQGLQLATGDCLMVLNNDVLVAGDWLARMTRAAYLPRVGLVSCRTHAVSGPQRLIPDYTDLHDFPLFARRYAALADGSWFDLPRVVAFALLWRREVYERIGGFDERYMPANFEDDDYALRSMHAGYRNVVANDVFIHHVGAASHDANQLTPNVLVQENGRRFIAKWGAAAAPFVAAVWTDYDAHISLLEPEQYALPGWALPQVPPTTLARHLAKVGRRLGRHGWYAEARAACCRSMRTAVTAAGITGWLWNARRGWRSPRGGPPHGGLPRETAPRS
jgi:GT2 family glycosyltransferase/2-polyprenyl-3-methyl-5-hydroxy-6-metoxy-1,4-benzoquinol methylase